MKPLKENLKMIPHDDVEFLRESNAIERVYDEPSLEQAQYAWLYLLSQPVITEDVVLHTHHILMVNQPLEEKWKGRFRTVPIWVGGREGVRWEKITLEIQDWCDAMNFGYIYDEATKPQRALTKEEHSKRLHVDYEKIHPFVDGNGRTGRMFMNWWRLKNGLPIMVIHEGAEQMAYYQWFKE